MILFYGSNCKLETKSARYGAVDVCAHDFCCINTSSYDFEANFGAFLNNLGTISEQNES